MQSDSQAQTFKLIMFHQVVDLDLKSTAVEGINEDAKKQPLDPVTFQ